MRIVIALGGNALLRRGEVPTADNQRRNVHVAVQALAPLSSGHELIITHGNGPQVGLLALQGAALPAGEMYPLDILDAETEGMIGYLIEQELANRLPAERCYATLLTQVEVDSQDPAFNNPTKPIGPVYEAAEARRLAGERGWHVARDGAYFRRVVPSPRPLRILELGVIEMLVSQGVIVICAGGGEGNPDAIPHHRLPPRQAPLTLLPRRLNLIQRHVHTLDDNDRGVGGQRAAVGRLGSAAASDVNVHELRGA